MSSWDVRWPVMILASVWPVATPIGTRLPPDPVIVSVLAGDRLPSEGGATGTAAQIVAPVVQLAHGTAVGRAQAGQLTASVAQSATGRAVSQGVAHQAVAGLTQVASGGGVRVGAASQVIAPMGQAAAGHGVGRGVSAQAIAPLHQAAYQARVARGAADQPVAAMVQAALGVSVKAGVLTQTAAVLAQVAAGTGVSRGAAAQALSATGQMAVASAIGAAHAAQVSGGVSQVASGRSVGKGVSSQAIASLIQVANGRAVGQAVSAQSVAAIMQAATGRAVGKGAAAQTIAALAQAAQGRNVGKGTAAQAIAALVQAASGGSGSSSTPGTFVAASPMVSGTGTVTVAFGSTGRTAGDLLIIAVETANQAVAINSPGGWYPLLTYQGTGTGGAAGAVRITLFAKISTGTEGNVVVSDSGDHQTARGTVWRGVDVSLAQNLIKNSADMTSSDWAVYDGNGVGAAISDTAYTDPDGNPAFKVSWGSTYREYLAIYPDDNTTCAPSTTYRLKVWARTESGTAKFCYDAYDGSDHFSADFTVTTAGDYYYFDYTTGSSTSLKYAQMWQLTSASDASAASLIIGKPQISVVPDADYVRTTTAPVTTFKGVNASAGGTQAATTAFSFLGVTTTIDSCLIAHFIANDRDAASTANLSNITNANLSSLTLQFDETVIAGQGGGLDLITGIKATAGATGNTTATQAGAGNTNACITLALAPAA